MELKGREIFAVGKWNGMEFRESDLDDIVKNFETLKDIHKVPLKFGHNDEQPITDGQPAIGWVDRVFRQGKKLYADFVDMPKPVFESIRRKLYRTVSIELLFDVDHNGNRYGHVLDAVALLGADHPAVNTLADLDTLLASRTSFAGGQRYAFETIAGNRNNLPPKKEVSIDMDEKELKQFVADAVANAVAPLTTQLENVTKERDEFKKKSEEHSAAVVELQAYKDEQRKQKIKASRDVITDLLDTAVREQKMTPAMREVYSSQIGLDDDDRVTEIDVDKVKLMCEAKPGKTSGNAAQGGDTGRSGDAGKDLVTKTHAFMAEHGEQNFARALTAVARANPDLHKEWLDSNFSEA